MSDLKIPGGQLARVTVATGTGGAQVNADVLPPGVGKKVDAPPPADAFNAQLPLGAETEQLTGQAQGQPVPAFALAADARQIQDPAEALGQFQEAFAAARDELLDYPGLPADALGQRANEFFTEFAKAFVQTAAEQLPPPPEQAPPPTPEKPEGSAQERPQQQQERQGSQASPEQRQLAREFADSLKSLGFQALKNLANGKDGVENAFQLLTSEGLKEFAAQAKEQMITVQGEFPPRPASEHNDSLPPQPEVGAEKQEIGEGPGELDGQAAAERTGQEEEELRLPADPDGVHVPEDEEEEELKSKKRRRKSVLSGWLDTFRRRDENVRQAEEKWDRVVVSALLFLLFVALVVVALVSL